jgi:RND family efflux transporter MFP subunit
MFSFKNIIVLFVLIISLSIRANTINVDVVYAKEEARNLEIELSGNIKALNDAQLTSLESGIVKSLEVDEGDQVTLGQTLIRLDDSLALIELAQANAAYHTAEIKAQEDLRLFNEIVSLAKQKVVAKTQLAERKANAANSNAKLSEAKAKVKLQQEMVNRHVLLAPFSGTIAERNTDLGEWVSPQSKILQLVSDDSLRIFIDIPQEYFNDVNKDPRIKVLVTPDIEPQQTIELSLSQFIKVSNPVSRTFKARIDLPPETQLVSGMSARVRLILPTQNGTQVNLPKSSLKRHPDGSYSVYSVVQDKVKRMPVKLINSTFNNVVVQGVPQNAAIIVSGNDLLIENQTVSVSKEKGTN